MAQPFHEDRFVRFEQTQFFRSLLLGLVRQKKRRRERERPIFGTDDIAGTKVLSWRRGRQSQAAY